VNPSNSNLVCIRVKYIDQLSIILRVKALYSDVGHFCKPKVSRCFVSFTGYGITVEKARVS